MDILIYITLFLITWGLSYIKFKTHMNIVSIFTGLWCFFGILSSFGMYGMRTPVLQVHLYVCLFVCIVDMVIMLFGKQHYKMDIRLPSESENEPTEICEYKSYASFIQVIALIFYMPMIFNAFQAFLESGFVGIRNSYFGAEYESQYLFSLLCKTMPGSFITGLIVHYIYSAFETRRWKFFIYAALNAILLMLVNGGRYALMQVLLSAVVLMVMRSRSVKRADRQERVFKKKIKKGIVAIALVMFMVTIFREQEIFKNIVVYFSGSFSFLDYILDNPADFGLAERLNGYLTFGCITEPIVLGLKVLGLTTMKTPSYLFNIVGQNFYDIGSGSTTLLFNNNTTVIYYFLRDFGVWGIVIGGIFLSSLVVYSYNRWSSGSRFHALIFVYMAVVLLNSIMTYQLFGCNPFFVVVAMYFCCKRAKIRVVWRR
jgi:oligosaccharide repeat unit polymerase